MNSPFWTWLIAASAVALGLLLLLLPAGPGASPAEPVGSQTGGTAYFEPVLPPAEAPPSSVAPCSPCRPAPGPVPPPAGGCNRPVGPCPPVQPPIPPRINRSLPPCIDECSFIQLHTTIPQPIPGCLRFEWLATDGGFLDPTASDPIYYAPTTPFPGGEDVSIVLTVTDPTGAVYTDCVKLHVRDVR